MPNIPTYDSKVNLIKDVGAQQFSAQEAGQTGRNIATAGEAIGKIGDAFGQISEHIRKVNIQNELDQAELETQRELGQIQLDAENDPDYSNLHQKYKERIIKSRDQILGKIKEPEAQNRFINTFDQNALRVEIGIKDLENKKVIDQKRGLLWETLEADKDRFNNAIDETERNSVKQTMFNRINDHVKLGIVGSEQASKYKIALEDELKKSAVENDIDSDPNIALKKLDSGEYKDLNSEEKNEFRKRAESAIRRRQIIYEEDLKKTQDQNQRILTDKYFNKSLTEKEVIDAHANNEINTQTAEHLIKNLRSEKAIKAKDDLSVWSELNKKVRDYDYPREDIELEILNAQGKGLLKEDTAKTLINKSMSIDDTRDSRLIKVNNIGLKVWADESSLDQKDVDKLEYNIEKRILDENPQGEETINALYEEEKNKLLREKHPDILPLKTIPNTIYKDNQFEDIINIPAPSKPNFIFDQTQNKLIPNNSETELYTVYVPKKSAVIGFSQKPEAKQLKEIIRKEFYPKDYNNKMVAKVKQYFKDWLEPQQTEATEIEPSQDGIVLSSIEPNYPKSKILSRNEELLPFNPDTMYEPKTTIGHRLADMGRYAQSLIESGGKGFVQDMVISTSNAVGGALDMYLDKADTDLDKIYQEAGQKPPDNKIGGSGKKLAGKIEESFNTATGGMQLDKNADYGQELAYKFGSGGSSLFKFLGASLLTGGSATVPGVIAGVQQAGLKYQQSKDAGKTQKESRNIAGVSGLIEGSLEGLGFNFLLKKYGGFISSTAIRSFTEGTQEVLQTSSEQGIDVLTGLRQNPSMVDIIQENFESFLIGAGLGMPSSVMISQAERSGFIDELQQIGFNKGQARKIASDMVIDARNSVRETVNDEIQTIQADAQKTDLMAEKPSIILNEEDKMNLKSQPNNIQNTQGQFEEQNTPTIPELQAQVKKYRDEGKQPPVELVDKLTQTQTEAIIYELEKEDIANENPIKTPKGFYYRYSPANQESIKPLNPPKTPEELKLRIDQLNKFAQANTILRRTGGLTAPGKSITGQYIPEGESGEVRLDAKYISNDKDYIATLAHELGHGIEYITTGTIGKNTFNVFGNLDETTRQTVEDELKAVTLKLEGETAVNENPEYYNSLTELLARYFEQYITNPESMAELAPKATELIERMSVKHPLIREFLEVAHDGIDKGQLKVVPMRDMRETYHKVLGKRAGETQWKAEIAHRAMQERGKIVIEKFIKSKFKNVKDDAGLLFKAAESIKYTKNNKPVFGTRDFVTAKTDAEIQEFEGNGFERAGTVIENGVEYPQYARQRYTAQEARNIYNQLSPEGKKLIKEFTAVKDEAKDFFNREVIKDVYKIKGNIEGWVHHYFEDKPSKGSGKSKRFKFQKAGMSLKREGAEGYVEDLQKAIAKAVTEANSTEVYNKFVQETLARISKPIPEGQSPDEGWVEVVGTLEKGIGTTREKNKTVIIQDGKAFVPKQPRYQIPKPIYERYKLWRDGAEEASKAIKTIQAINRYWRINILTHIGSAGTNFISGGITYTSKVLTDFYTELLTGSGFKQTGRNLNAIIAVLTPKGWAEAPDWVYGGDLSNYYGQFGVKQEKTNQFIDSYGQKALKLYGTIERYWKKVIATAEGMQDLESLNNISKEGLKLPTKEEAEIIAQINEQIDLFAYDYDNIPTWLAQHNKSVLGQSIKPFSVYPYKYAKQIINMAQAIFDGTLPWQERVAKLLSLTTMMSVYAGVSYMRKKEQETPEGTPETPARLSPRGRLFLGKDEDGKELFVRTAKYPFFNITDTAMSLIDGDIETASDQLTDMVGSIAPLGKIGMALMGYRSKYEKYDSLGSIVGNNLSTYVPASRIFNDVARMLDPFKRKQEGFTQAFTKLIPVTSEDLQEKLHGEKRIEKVPVEGSVKKQAGEGIKRTTTDKELKEYWQDVLLSSLTGIYTTRIDPKDAEAYQIRADKNKKKKENKKK